VKQKSHQDDVLAIHFPRGLEEMAQNRFPRLHLTPLGTAGACHSQTTLNVSSCASDDVAGIHRRQRQTQKEPQQSSRLFSIIYLRIRRVKLGRSA
jgi:hypothetical protein